MVSAALIISSGIATLDASACGQTRMLMRFIVSWYTGFGQVEKFCGILRRRGER